MLRRIWTGIVAATAGGVLAMVFQIVGQMTVGLSIDFLPWILLTCAGGGFLLGVLFRPRASKSPGQEQSGSIRP